MEAICEDENKTNSIYLHIINHNTNDHIIQLWETFLKVQ